MGGRRARSTAEIFGPAGPPTQGVRKLQSSLDSENPEEIAAASSSLAAKAVEGQNLNQYLDHFLPFIERQIRAGEGPKNADEWEREVRGVWSGIKDDKSLSVRGVVSEAVVQAVVNLLRRLGL